MITRRNPALESGASLETSTGWLHLFGDSTRLRLLALLEDHEHSVADLTTITELSQSRVSTHLGRLREAGLLHDRRVGNSTRYRLHGRMPPAAEALWKMLRSQLSDATLQEDEARRDALLAARNAEPWVDAVAGSMERHYSPGRTWEALVHGLSGLLRLGDVLDVGCGDGWSARLVAPRAQRYVGFDKSPKVLEAARRRCQDAENVTFREGDLHALPFDDASFDTLLLFHVLTYAERPSAALAEAARVLRPGGLVAVVTLASHDSLAEAGAYGHIQPGFAPEVLRTELEAVGLTVEQCAVTSRERRKPHYEVLTAVATKD
ncbi:MAG: metalloregulator ArsR/SmtB family transcription factor [Myxococcota bacterium]